MMSAIIAPAIVVLFVVMCDEITPTIDLPYLTVVADSRPSAEGGNIRSGQRMAGACPHFSRYNSTSASSA